MFIEFTTPTGNPKFLNPDLITTWDKIERMDKSFYFRLYTSYGEYVVQENPELVFDKIGLLRRKEKSD